MSERGPATCSTETAPAEEAAPRTPPPGLVRAVTPAPAPAPEPRRRAGRVGLVALYLAAAAGGLALGLLS